MTVKENPFLTAAMGKAQKGVPVFPCVPRNKNPITGHGFKDATTDKKIIREWWTKYPDANIAIPTGELSGPFVLDVDMGNGKDGEGTLAKLIAEHGPLPTTLEVRTPRGGRHLYFKHPGQRIPTRTNHPAPALDVRGDGGYVLVPPSRTQEGEYRYTDTTAPAECPGWLLAMLVGGKRETEKALAVTPVALSQAENATEKESRIRDALQFIRASDYATWIKVGMALHSWDDIGGLAIWDEWSRTCPAKYHEDELPKKWASFKNDRPDGVTLGTLFDLAKRGGWLSSVAVGVDGGTADFRSAIVQVLCSIELKLPQKGDQVARIVVDSLTSRGSFYYHRLRREFAAAMFFDGETKRLLLIQSDEFVAWLSSWTGINRGAPIFRYVQAGVETTALSGDKTTSIIPETYWASRTGVIYISNGDGSVVKITANKVELYDNGVDGVLFGAGATLPPWKLAGPVDPFASCSLFAGANFADCHGPHLFCIWVVSLPTCPVCKPPLAVTGPVRSGKTRIVRGISELFGLPFAAKEPEATEKSQTDFWVSMDAGGVFCLDNVDSRVSWLPDAIAAASTGVGDIRRKLYSDNRQIELKPHAWLALTSATPLFAADVGLADRLFGVRLNRRDGETSDESLSAEIAANRDAGLSWIAHKLAVALADTAPVPAGLNRRHPDFAVFAVRIGRALGREADAIAALRAAESDKSRLCLENDPVGVALLTMIEDGKGFVGTAAELLDELAKNDRDFGEDAKGAGGTRFWTAKRLGKRLSTLWPNVVEVFDARQEKDKHGHAASFTIKKRLVRFETLKQEKSSCEGDIGSLLDSAKETAETALPQIKDPFGFND
jgi:hypothetical protein